MADDNDSIFARAGFQLPKPSAAPPAPAKSDAPSIFEAAGYSLPGTSQSVASDAGMDWQQAEALENAAASGIKMTAPSTAPTKPGRGIWQAIKDYPAHLVRGVIDTAAGPGNVLASGTPSTSESLIPGGVGLAGLIVGSEFPRVAGAKVVGRVGNNGRAVNKLVEAIGPENVPALVNRLQENPRLSIADVSDPVRTMTQGLIDPSHPKVQNLVADAVKKRQETLPAAVNTAYTEAMGPAPNVVQMVEGLKDRARKAGSEAIQPALANAKPVDVSPVIAAIDEKLKPGLTAMMGETKLPLSALEQELVRVKSRLTDGENQVFDPNKLHSIQSDIGDQAFQLSKSPDPKDRRMGAQLREVNEKLIDQIDTASGGAYRPARAKFKDAKDIHEAFDAGFDTLKNRAGVKGLEDRPEALKEWMKDATPEEVVARRIGTRSDIDQKIRSAKNQALAGESITRIEYNQEKLRTLFGDKEAGRLIRVMKDAQDEAATNGKLLAGSKTAETIAGREALKVREVQAGNPLQYAVPFMSEFLGTQYGIPGVGAAMMGLKGAHLGTQKIGQMMDIARNYEFARNALATGFDRKRAVDSLMSHPKVVRELKKSSNALTVP